MYYNGFINKQDNTQSIKDGVRKMEAESNK